MVEKKFNFYNTYKFFYKNINESVFFYDTNIFRDFGWELYADNVSRIYINYFGIFYLISSNFVKYVDLYILNTIFKNKKPPLESKFNVKKFFYKTCMNNHNKTNFFIKFNFNNYLVCYK